MLEIEFGVLVLLIALSAFFSGTETALMSISPVKAKTLLKEKKRGSEALYRIKQNPHRLIITILIGNNLVNIGAAAVAAIVFTDLFGSTGVGIATGIMTFLVLVFGEVTPKTFAIQNAERVSLLIARPIEVLSIILSPFVRFFELIARAMTRLLGSREEKKLSEEELRTIVTMGREEGILSRESAEMMRNVLDFRGTKVFEVMTRGADIKMVDGNAMLKDILSFVVKTPFSRYPVYLKDENNIIGILDVDDVLKCAKNKQLGRRVKSIAREVGFVPEAKEIDDLLVEFEGRAVPLAMVVDEYGKISGLVTVEDILEEIVGDIFDKSRRTSVYIKRVRGKFIRVDAKASIEEVNRVLHLGIRAGPFNTIAGYIEHKLQKMPKKGERVVLKNVIIEVDKATKRSIKSVKIIKKK